MSIYSRMYGNAPRQTTQEQPIQKKEDEFNKSAVRSLSGMKVHGSHMLQIDVEGDIVDVPKVEYVSLLEKQIKDSREKIKRLEIKVERLEKNYLKLATKIRDLK